MKKTLQFLALILCMTLNAKANVISFTPKETGLKNSSYITTAVEFIYDSITFKVNQFNPSTGQIKVNNIGNSAFSLWNKTAISNIREVRIYVDANTVGAMYMRLGDASISDVPTSNDVKGNVSTSENGYVVTFTVPENKEKDFFRIQLVTKGSGTVKASKFEIDFLPEGGGIQPIQSKSPSINGISVTGNDTTVTFTDSLLVDILPDMTEPDAALYYQSSTEQFYTPGAYASNLYKGSFTITESTYVCAIAKNGENEVSKPVKVFFKKRNPEEYMLVTDPSGLEVGAKYVIAYTDEGNSYAASTAEVGNKKLHTTGVSIEDNILIPQEDIMVFTLEDSEQEGKYKLRTNNYNNTRDSYYLTLSTSGTDAKIETTTTNANLDITFDKTGYVKISNAATRFLMKYIYNNEAVFGHYASSNSTTKDYHVVYLYKKVPGNEKPGCPVITYTTHEGGEALEVEEFTTYTVVNGSTITVTSEHATQIEVNGTKYDAPDGVYTFTQDVDDMIIVQGVNAVGNSEEMLFEILVDYEASTLRGIHELSKKQKDRKDKSQNAPVKLNDFIRIRGHYMLGGLYEILMIEDEYGKGGSIFHADGEFGETPASIENNMTYRNVVIRSAQHPAGNYDALQFVSWPTDTVNDIRTYNFSESLPSQLATTADETNVHTLQKYLGNIEFGSNNTATITLTNNGKVIALRNGLSMRGNESPSNMLRMDNNDYNWLPGGSWPEAGTKLDNTYVAGFVMPENDQYVVYPAQVTNNDGNLTGVDEIEDGNGVLIYDGRIIAPNGSRIYSISGAMVENGVTVERGVYLVILANGRTMKVVVK